MYLILDFYKKWERNSKNQGMGNGFPSKVSSESFDPEAAGYL
jgi:hypothetical protein